jgi:hypothetical protein
MATKKEDISELELILAGSPEELKANIPLLLAIAQIVKFYVGQTQASTNKPPISPEFADFLQLTVHWKGITEKTYKNHTIEKSIRLKKINAKTVQLSTLQDLGKAVISKFNNIQFKTGHVMCKYAKYKDGINTYGYFQDQATGYKIIEALGDIGGFNIDKERFRYQYILDEAKGYKQKPNKIQVAGKSLRPRATAPIANMKFSHATITFPWIGHTEQLCNIGGYVIKDLKFLDIYNE